MILNLYTLAHQEKQLRQVAEAVHFDGDILPIGTRRLIENMIATLRDHDGYGLAAPQVGHPLRIIVIDGEKIPNPVSPRDAFALIDPVVTPLTQAVVDSREGCLSVPGFTGVVDRSAKVRVQALSTRRAPLDFEASGLLACVVQHEVDHLNGVLFVDRLSKLKRELYRKQLSAAKGEVMPARERRRELKRQRRR